MVWKTEQEIIDASSVKIELNQMEEYPYRKSLFREFYGFKSEVKAQLSLKEEVGQLKVDMIRKVENMSEEEVIRASGIWESPVFKELQRTLSDCEVRIS